MSHVRAINLPPRYETATKTFSGGQGQVLVCKDTYLNREVAIKVIKDATDRETLQREIASLSAIESKHVVQIFDFIKDPKTAAAGIVQEYLAGDDVSDFSTGGMKSVPDYLKVLFQIASGIADIHSHGKIHRDIKPINMKFDAEGILKIFDFGLACDHKPAPVTTAARGTDVYRAPELYAASPVTFTPAVDTYAFGVSAWEILDPKFPRGFLEMPPFDTSAAPSFSTQAIGLPPAIVNILDLTLSRDPEARPTMSQVRDVVVGHLLFGKHEGRLTYDDKSYKLAGINKSIGIKTPGFASFALHYDGFAFCVRNISGNVNINNISAVENAPLPGSCVITISPQDAGQWQRYLTFDISHPEVII